MAKYLIEAHGGRLVNLMMSEQQASELKDAWNNDNAVRLDSTIRVYPK